MIRSEAAGANADDYIQLTLFFATALFFVFLVWGGAEIYVAANLLAPGLGISTGAMILIIAAVVGTYSTMGGFRAVVSTDKLQYGVVVLYILAMAWLAWIGLRQAGGELLAATGPPVETNPALAVLDGRLGARSRGPGPSRDRRQGRGRRGLPQVPPDRWRTADTTRFSCVDSAAF